MESLISMEFLLSIDSVLSMATGVVIALLVTQISKGWGFGLIGNLVAGLIGGLFGGAIFNTLDIMDIGDYADPIIAGAVGATLVLLVGGAIRR